MKFLAITAAAAALLATPALAGEREFRLPDGSSVTVLSVREGGWAAPSMSAMLIYHCDRDDDNCVLLQATIESDSGVISGVPEAIVHALGGVSAARALRPDQTMIISDASADADADNETIVEVEGDSTDIEVEGDTTDVEVEFDF